MRPLNEIFEETARLVLEDEYHEYSELYKVRLNFLYGLILENRDSDEIIDHMVSFEISQRPLTTLTLGGFGDVTESFALSVFSSAAFGLAVEHIKGNAHTALAARMHEIYEALIEDREVISQAVMEEYSGIVSETLLDFIYAGGNTQIMSLRLKRQNDLMM